MNWWGKLYYFGEQWQNAHRNTAVSSDMTNATNKISLELLTVSKNDDSSGDFMLRPALNRNFFSNEKSCSVGCFIPLRTGRVRIARMKFNHSKLLFAVCDIVIHRDWLWLDNVHGRNKRLSYAVIANMCCHLSVMALSLTPLNEFLMTSPGTRAGSVAYSSNVSGDSLFAFASCRA